MSQYLKINLSDTQGQFIFSVNTDGNAQAGTYATSVEYSFDNDTWSTLQLNSGNNTIQLGWGGGSLELYLRNDSGVWSRPSSYGYWYITISCPVDYEIMEGSLSALLDYNDDSVVPPSGAFARLFKNDTHLTTFMPEFVTETLSNNLCEEMFYGCTNLTTAMMEFTGYPTTIPYSCFLDTFHGCTSLDNANISVVGQADTFGDRSCEGMFTGCTSLIDFSNFPMQASTLGSSCFEEMYYGCTNANTLGNNLTLPATTLAQSCYKGMFRNCTSLDKQVILPATSVLSYSYQQMFSGCTSLSEVVTYADTIDTTYPGTANWLQNVAGSGTVYNMGSATYTVDSASGIPVGWSEVQLQSSYTVTATAGQNGSISPSGAVTVNTFDSQFFTFTPDAGYEVDTVTVDGSTVTPTNNTYTFTNVQADHTISVTFKELSDYFYIERTSGSGMWTITITQNQGSTTGYATSVEYSTDGWSWIHRNLYTGTNNFSIFNYQGNKVYFRNDSGNWSTTGIYNKFNVDNNVPHITGGNPNSLLDYTDMDNVSLIDGCFYRLFNGDTNLTSASDLRLPSMTLATSCYNQMFTGCTSLTSAPSLPATTLAQGCYNQMFTGCTSLTSAPSLPATTLAQGCYGSMFYGCTSLTAAPSLPATTLAQGCYGSMFYGCTSLTSAPTLPATTLVQTCYREMFSGCTSLNEVTTYADNIPTPPVLFNCTTNWLQNVAATGTFYNNGSATYTVSSSGIPLGWTEVRPTKTITATAGQNGSISPSGAVSVNVGASQTFTVTPDAGYIVDTLTVDGSTATLTNDTYTFSNVQADHTISVTFKLPDLTDYFYIENTYNGQNTVTLSTTGSSASQASSVEYSKDRNSWTTLTLTAGGTNTITLETGEKVYFRNDSGMWNSGSSNYNRFTANQTHIVGGNVNTLLDYTNLNNITLANYCFYMLFNGDRNLTSASNLSLPATTLASNCYSNMFNSCTALTTAPALPATTLVEECYGQMFTGCTALTTAPSLPATTLANRCYSNMFNGCTALTTAPSLPATTLEWNCYSDMFTGCTSLTAAPSLPATTLEWNCYTDMFNGCTSLNEVTTYANNISAVNCLTNWLQNVARPGIFYNNGSASYSLNSASGIPTRWTEVKPGQKIITATAGQNGSISPVDFIAVNTGASQTFTFIPDTGYEVDTVTVDGSTVTPTGNTYTFTNVTADHTISVTFELAPVYHTIVATAHENANISPSGSVSVLEGDDQSFSIYPDAGYEISDVEVDGSSVGAVTDYTFYNVTSNHTIDAYAIPIPPTEYQIMAFGYDHADINPSGTITVIEGNDQTFTMTADTGYQISDVLVDGSSVGAVSSYTFRDVQADHEITVYGEPIPVPTYNCSVTVATTGGSVMPLSATVDEGQDITFTVTTEAGYAIDNLIDNGTDVTSRMVGNTYTISDVSADHTLSISFVRVVIQYSIVSTAGEGGSISPLGRTYVDEGSSQTYTITPDEGNEIDRLIVDGHEVTPSATYTFENVASDHTIEASFKETPPPPPPVPDYGLNFDEFKNRDYVVQYMTK